MIPKIFDIENEKVILSDTILRIPILNDLYETYAEEALDMMSVINFYCDIQGVYANYEEEEKLDCILSDLGFANREYKLNPDFCEILDWCKDKWLSTGEKFYLNHKKNIETLGAWASGSMISDGLGGNVKDKIAMAKEVRKLYQELVAFENEIKASIKSRGQGDVAYDQM